MDPVEYFENCVFDSCGCDRGGDCECLCTAISNYAALCNEKGVAIRWRSAGNCGKFRTKNLILCGLEFSPHNLI